MSRDYYSLRSGKIHKVGFDLDQTRNLIFTAYKEFDKKEYFQEFFGYNCVDTDFVPGRFGDYDSIKAKVLIHLKIDLWPFTYSLESCSENELFDIIEFLFDFISAPITENGYFHNYCNCGWHYKNLDTDFDKEIGQKEFRQEINKILSCYLSGYELTEKGEIFAIPDKGFATLLNRDVPFREDDLEKRLGHAIDLFRNRHSTKEQRRDALKNLGDILEKLRNDASKILTKKDENDLFQVLNNFGIRHNNVNQQTNYEINIFYSWMFYYYLASIHACQRLINRKTEEKE